MNRRRILVLGASVVVLVLGAGVYLVASTWGDVQRVTIDRPHVSAQGDPSEPAHGQAEEEEPVDESVAVEPTGDGVNVTVLVGSDSRDSLDDTEGFGDFEGQRADVVMVMVQPGGSGDTPAIFSIPRDLWVEDVCDGGFHRINDALEGCDSMNGPTAVVHTVEALIGITVDHFAMVDLAGFQEAVDAIGGYEICVDLPVRDSRAKLELPAGCTLADGEQALAWLRSRHTQELTEDGWRLMRGVSDLTRNERQREFMISIMGRVGDLSNPQDVVAIAQSVAPYVTVDDGLSLMNAVDLATVFRAIGSDRVIELELPVADHVADSGAAVLIATVNPSQIVAEFLAPATAEGAFGDTG